MSLWAQKVLPKAGLGLYFPTESTTEIDVAGTFQDIEGAFTYLEEKGFTHTAEYAEYTGKATRAFDFAWNATISCQNAGATVHIGKSINTEVLGEHSPSVMGAFCKFGDEIVNLSGSFVTTMSTGDRIQFQTTSDTAGDIVKVHHFTATIRPLYGDISKS